GSAWGAGERDDMIARLEAWLARTEAAAALASSPKPDATQAAPPLPALPELRAEDRALYGRALDALQRGDAASAWSTGAPLFKAYPRAYAVQDLRCQIAMRRGLPWPAVREECDAMMRLSTAH